jgi:1-acyl-sn-glycerol-3-phosphate acyltransferase
MSFERYRDRADDPRVLRQITDEIMFELRQQSGQEYVDSYAARKTVVGVAEESRVRTTSPSEPIAAAG